MSAAIPPISFGQIPAMPPERPWRLSVHQYHEMIQSGIFGENDSVELLDGWLFPKMPKKPQHTFTTEQIREELGRRLPPGWFVRAQDPITTADSEPEPDIGVVRGQRRDYLDRHPGPADLGLIVEVSDSTLPRDRGVKKTVYARAQISVYWIVDLNARQIEVYSEPTVPSEPPDYLRNQVYGENDRVPIVLDSQVVGELEVRLILP